MRLLLQVNTFHFLESSFSLLIYSCVTEHLGDFTGTIFQSCAKDCDSTGVRVDFKTRVKLIAHYHSVQNIYGIKNLTL